MGNAKFPTTHWSIVLEAGIEESPDSRTALAKLCEAYWYPVYARIRRVENNIDAAKDLTQSFFYELLEKRSFSTADPERGRFRSYLTVLLNRFMSHQRRSEQALKRGGGVLEIDLDFESAESRFRNEPADTETPETLFEKAWARTIVTRAMERFRDGLNGDSDVQRFHRLEPFLTGGTSGQDRYRQVAGELGTTEAAVKTAVYRMRRKFGTHLRAEVAETVGDPGLVDSELRHLFTILVS